MRACNALHVHIPVTTVALPLLTLLYAVPCPEELRGGRACANFAQVQGLEDYSAARSGDGHCLGIAPRLTLMTVPVGLLAHLCAGCFKKYKG